MLNDLFAQHKKLDLLLARVETLLEQRRITAHDADRVDYSFVDSVVFGQQDNTARDIVFSIPNNTDFVAERFGLYPLVRFVTTDPVANGPNELVHRPCIFSFYEGAYMQAGDARFNFDAASVDCFLQFSENFIDEKGREQNRAYQNMPFPAQLLFAGAVNYKSTAFTQEVFGILDVSFDRYYANFEFPSAMLFPVDWYLPAGSDFQIKVAPSFASVRSDPEAGGGDPTLQNEYKLVAVLEGYKKVRR